MSSATTSRMLGRVGTASAASTRPASASAQRLRSNNSVEPQNARKEDPNKLRVARRQDQFPRRSPFADSRSSALHRVSAFVFVYFVCFVVLSTAWVRLRNNRFMTVTMSFRRAFVDLPDPLIVHFPQALNEV